MKKTILSGVIFIFSFYPVISQHAVTGTVTDHNGAPLAGASVFDKKSFLGTVTDPSGKFVLSGLPEGVRILGIQHLGFKDLTDTIRVSGDENRNYQLELSPFISDEFVVEATRAGKLTPVTHQNLSKEEIEENNLGQDLPFLLNQTVSTVTTSDAGAGVGYTGIRIRGSDATRINVTVNGVPVNDAESHGVFWVNMPDFASTTNNIQIQRGVGTSTNGAGAFGATINLQTTELDSITYVEFNNSYGSFNTRKHNVIYNSGLISNHFNFEGRLSFIGSDGYIDRSASDLRSYYFSGGYYGKKTMLKGVTFSGREITHQAWYGTPESRITGDDVAMTAHAKLNEYSAEQTENLIGSGRTYNYYTYDNEVDHYQQDHYQLIFGRQLSRKLYLNVTGHYTYGRGYFEQFKAGEDLADFGLAYPVIGTDTIMSSDVIVRRWLDNHFYGGVYSLQYSGGSLKLVFGGGYNEYIGDHFGEIIWAEYAVDTDIRQRYYFSESRKADLSQYVKGEYQLGSFTLFADLQVRMIDYTSAGVDNDQRPINIDKAYTFVNPKAGIGWHANDRNHLYLSFAQASREPVRSDFTDAVAGTQPAPEYLSNVETGWQHRAGKWMLGLNAYLMYYKDQLVLTGEVNDVGSPVRTNVPESYRAGVEAIVNVDLWEGLYWQPNLTVSQNKITEFEEVVYDYTTGYEVQYIRHTNTDIAFSPWLVAGSQLGYRTDFGFAVALLSKYVGTQYLDNTSNSGRAIDPYLVNDVRLSYRFQSRHWKNLELTLLVNNILNEEYESNGYTYSYIWGDLITENFYYPQAGINWLAGLKLRF